MTKLLAYHNDLNIKVKYIRRVETRGCAVGCTLEAYDHSRYPIELGVPETLAYLEDAIFEGLDKKTAMQWPARFLRAIPVGSDLSLVCARFAVWCLLNKEFGATALPNQPKEPIDCCIRVANLWQRVIDGESQDSLKSEFAREEDLAKAWVLVRVWAWAGARAWSRVWAWAGARAWSRAWAWAREEFWAAAANKLEELLKAAPGANCTL